MKLNDTKGEFDDLGVGVACMTYDKPEIIQKFYDKWEIKYPFLCDVDGQHVDAWGIRNDEYGPDSFAYGIPHPGVVFISPEGKILAKWAESGYRTRADWSDVLGEVREIVGSRSSRPAE